VALFYRLRAAFLGICCAIAWRYAHIGASRLRAACSVKNNMRLGKMALNQRRSIGYLPQQTKAAVNQTMSARRISRGTAL